MAFEATMAKMFTNVWESADQICMYQYGVQLNTQSCLYACTSHHKWSHNQIQTFANQTSLKENAAVSLNGI